MILLLFRFLFLLSLYSPLALFLLITPLLSQFSYFSFVSLHFPLLLRPLPPPLMMMRMMIMMIIVKQEIKIVLILLDYLILSELLFFLSFWAPQRCSSPAKPAHSSHGHLPNEFPSPLHLLKIVPSLRQFLCQLPHHRPKRDYWYRGQARAYEFPMAYLQIFSDMASCSILLPAGIRHSSQVLLLLFSLRGQE